MRKSFQQLFPSASQSCRQANPAILTLPANQTQKFRRIGGKKRGSMNKTEAEFARILHVQKQEGEILRYEFEGITLRWADMRYTPDFVVIDALQPDSKPGLIVLTLIEVKGAHIWDRDIVRFKGARAYWPEFAFEMHQRTKQGWKRLY